jgi:ABC-type branched-subunit amino acid transport system substrate-binding protein
MRISCRWLAAPILALTTAFSLATAQTADSKTLSIGISNIESGNGAAYRDIGQAFGYYLKYRNSTGGIGGYKFDVEILDNQLTPAGGAQTVRQFTASNKFAIMIVGTPAANGAFAILETEGKNIPVLSTGGTDMLRKFHSSGKLRNVFGMFPNYDKGALFDLQYLIKDLGHKKVALVYEDSAVGQGAGEIGPAFGKKLGASVESIAVAPTSTNMSPIAARLKNSGVEAVDVVARSSITAALQKAAAAIGYKPVWMTIPSNLSSSYLDLAGDSSEGTYFGAFMEPLSSTTPAVTTFKQAVAKFDPKAVNESGQAGWALGEIFGAAVERATAGGKPLTQAGVIKALTEFEGKAVGMILGAGYTEADHSTIASSLSVFQVKNGKFEKVKGSSPVPSP